MKFRAVAVAALWMAMSMSTAAPISTAVPAQLPAPQPAIDPMPDEPLCPAPGAIEELENRRAELEIEKLEAELHDWNKGLLIQAGTLLSAFAAALISAWFAAKTLTTQDANHKRDRISTLLQELGSDSALVRAAAIQALSEYEAAVPFLINALKMERDADVVETTALALQKHADRALSLLLAQSRHVYEQKLSLASALAGLDGVDRRSIAREFGLRNGDIQDWEHSGAGRRSRSTATNNGWASSDADRRASDSTRVRGAMANAFRAHANYVGAIEHLLRLPNGKDKKLKLTDSYLSGLDLDDVDISGWDFSRCILDHASFRRCVCTQASFTAVKAVDISFRGARLNAARFDNAHLTVADFREVKGNEVSFANSDIRDLRIDRVDLADADFKHAKLFRADIRNSNLRRALFTGARLFETTIDTCRLSESSFRSAVFAATNLRSLRCRGADFSESEFRNSSIFKGILKGCNFIGTKWIGTRVRL